MRHRPNILVVLSDQHNASVMGCAGDDVVRTPNMDRPAREGTLFENCFCPSPICVPARVSFVSGRRPTENQVVDNFDILSSRILTWPERMREADYHSVLVGRMHFEGPDQFHGFETTFAELRHWRGNRPVRNQEETPRVPGNSYWSPRYSVIDLSGSGRSFVQFRDEVVCERACGFLRESAKGSDERPFAAVVGFYNPHPPYVGPKELFDYYYERVAVPTEDHSLMPAYYANTEHVDARLGQILDVLDETKLYKDTLVIYCSDHGDGLGRRDLWGKESFYDDSARVPMIARLPRTIAAGEKAEHNVNLRDFGPTFIDIAGGRPLAGSDAASFRPVLEGCPMGSSDVTESEIIQGPSPFGLDTNVAYKMLCDGPWKMWTYSIDGKAHFSLFNRDEDPLERNDRIADPALKASVREMKAGRRADRRELDEVWFKDWLHAGYEVPEDIDADVDTFYSRRKFGEVQQ